MSEKLTCENILGVNITSENEEKILEYIITSLNSTSTKYYIVTPNPEIITYAKGHDEFRTILNEAGVSLPDGMGVVWAARLLGKVIKTRISGTDILYKLCKEVSKRPITMGFLGGRSGVAEATADCLQKKYPGLKVGLVQENWDENEFRRQLKEGGTDKIDILFVAFGFPKQEEWMAKNLPHIPVKVAMGVGGAFDYISGSVPRAPKLVQDSGLEWFYRLSRQPWRLKRQTALLKFVSLVLKKKLKNQD